MSDHEIVYVEASIKPRKINKPPRKVYQYNKVNTEEIKEKVRSIDIEKQLACFFFIGQICSPGNTSDLD
jgi:hypothetical protein